MSREHLSFECEGAQLAGTIDHAPGSVGLLIVTGGNETRAGAFSGQAQLAARIAAAGFPVFRFDRRGVGDSEGGNAGFRHSAADIAAAKQAFRSAMPRLDRIVAFGNCDAASALMLAHGAGMDALILANPWTIEDDKAPPPPSAIRSRYSEKLRNPSEIRRLLTGKVSLRKLGAGLLGALRPTPPPSTLAQQIAAGLARFDGEASILLASRDRTAQAFLAGWNAADPRLCHGVGADHAFSDPDARNWLFGQILAILENERDRS